MCFRLVEDKSIMNEKSDAKCKISQDDAKCSNSIIDESNSECFKLWVYSQLVTSNV